MVRLSANKPCPCHSGRKTKSCCGPILRGMNATTPVALMQSRYAAYATRHIDHIIKTTHPDSPHHQPNRGVWRNQVEVFCETFDFVGLTIHDSETEAFQGWVTFTAHLNQGKQDASFTECSRFFRQNGVWLYHSAIV